jgi:hypothetical protein
MASEHNWFQPKEDAIVNVLRGAFGGDFTGETFADFNAYAMRKQDADLRGYKAGKDKIPKDRDPSNVLATAVASACRLYYLKKDKQILHYNAGGHEVNDCPTDLMRRGLPEDKATRFDHIVATANIVENALKRSPLSSLMHMELTTGKQEDKDLAPKLINRYTLILSSDILSDVRMAAYEAMLDFSRALSRLATEEEQRQVLFQVAQYLPKLLALYNLGATTSERNCQLWHVLLDRLQQSQSERDKSVEEYAAMAAESYSAFFYQYYGTPYFWQKYGRPDFYPFQPRLGGVCIVHGSPSDMVAQPPTMPNRHHGSSPPSRPRSRERNPPYLLGVHGGPL